MVKVVTLTREGGKGQKKPLMVTVSAKGFPEGNSVVGVWRQDTDEIVGHSEIVAGANPEFECEFMLDHYFADPKFEVKFCAYTVQDGNTVDQSGFIGAKVISMGDLQKNKTPEHELEGQGVFSFRSVVKGPKKEKKAPKEQEVKISKEEKAAIKEGGKKGQDICGMSSFGVHFFLTAMDVPKGDFALLQHCMDGANKEVDPNGDDRKGGAGDLSKIFFSAGDDNLAMIAHVPVECQDKVTVEEFFGAVLAPLDGKAEKIDEFFMKCNIPADPDNNRYPLKMRDQAIAAGFAFLKEKGLVLDDDSDDDINFADECGVDLNAGAEGDY